MNNTTKTNPCCIFFYRYGDHRKIEIMYVDNFEHWKNRIKKRVTELKNYNQTLSNYTDKEIENFLDIHFDLVVKRHSSGIDYFSGMKSCLKYSFEGLLDNLFECHYFDSLDGLTLYFGYNNEILIEVQKLTIGEKVR